ncbi:hypothetical protein [Paenibacillus sp. B-A-8]|uniref:hypothetical protein n=1 Tax=Paenibacillus sp. B-A-8 TaxID=3400419 RepID=UPI003B0272FD
MVNGGFPDIISARCESCNQVIMQPGYEIHTFSCPECNGRLSLHISAKNETREHTAFAVLSSELTAYEDKTVLLNDSFFHQIIKVDKQGGKIRVALKNHGTIKCDPESFWIIIRGGWWNNWQEN